MSLSSLLAKLFEIIPENSYKNSLRYFLAFNPLVPKFIQDISPIKGYELYRQLKKGDVVVDAGAFTGDYTVFAAKKVGPKGKVIAFEPDSKNREILRKNLEVEKIKNVIIIPRGLWNKESFLKFNSSNGLHSNIQGLTGNISIPVSKLDNEIKKLKIKRLDFIKMDIEGAEIEALMGSLKTLKEFHPSLAIASYHVVNGNETSIFLEGFLKKIGYNVKSDFPNHKTTYAW